MSGAGLTCARQTIESMYIMWRTTGDSVWRDRAWDVFQALEREAKTESGYASLRNVAESPARKMDEQPRCVVVGLESLLGLMHGMRVLYYSYFLAET